MSIEDLCYNQESNLLLNGFLEGRVPYVFTLQIIKTLEHSFQSLKGSLIIQKVQPFLYQKFKGS